MAKAFDYIQVPLAVVATDLTGVSVEVEGAYFRAARLLAVNGPMKLEDLRRKIGTHADVEHALNHRSADVEPLLSFGWLEEWRERANASRERLSKAGHASAEKRAKKKSKKNTSSTSVELMLNDGSTNVEQSTILYSNLREGISGKERARTIAERIAAFTAEAIRVNDQRGTLEPDELTKFIAYWTQAGPNDRKFHAEKQQTFEVAARLTTWSGRVRKPIGRPGAPPPPQDRNAPIETDMITPRRA